MKNNLYVLYGEGHVPVRVAVILYEDTYKVLYIQGGSPNGRTFIRSMLRYEFDRIYKQSKVTRDKI